MALPIKYNVRNLVIRWRSTITTMLGVALVVAVYVLVQALAVGLEKASQNTGDPRNTIILRKGSTAESVSQITRAQYREILYLPQIARDQNGNPLVSADVIVLINLPRKQGRSEANVLVRGISPMGRFLRPQVRLVAGRWFVPGNREIVVSAKLAERFANFDIGSQIKTGGKLITIVGWLDGGDSAYDSECWMDADEARSLFDRENYSSVLLRVNGPEAALAISNRVDTDKRLSLRAMPETEYYSKQTMTAKPIKVLGGFLATVMSIGAIFAAMNTLYASVGARVREIGTLRVLGYRRRAILMSFIIEGALLSLAGGLLGGLLALPLHGYTTATIGFETFSETIFQFRITPALFAEGLLFSLIVGVIGSLLPAIRAARLPVIAALRAA